jgi:hypothetical protein
LFMPSAFMSSAMAPNLSWNLILSGLAGYGLVDGLDCA